MDVMGDSMRALAVLLDGLTPCISPRTALGIRKKEDVEIPSNGRELVSLTVRRS